MYARKNKTYHNPQCGSSQEEIPAVKLRQAELPKSLQQQPIVLAEELPRYATVKRERNGLPATVKPKLESLIAKYYLRGSDSSSVQEAKGEIKNTDGSLTKEELAS